MTKRIIVCCDAMGDTMMMNDIRESIIIDKDGAFIWWKDGDTMPMNYCPNCGKKVRFKEEKEMREIVKKDKKALDGAYVKGQTNLDGDMVVEEGTETVAVQKGVAPWTSTQRQ